MTNRTADVPLREHGTLARIRHRVERLGPYPSLMLLAVPTSIVEPLKLVAVAIAGEGRWGHGRLGDRRRLRRQPPSRRAAVCDRQAEADDIALVRSPLDLAG